MAGYLHFAIAKDGAVFAMKTGFKGFEEGELKCLEANTEMEHGGLALTLNKAQAIKLAAQIMNAIAKEN